MKIVLNSELTPLHYVSLQLMNDKKQFWYCRKISLSLGYRYREVKMFIYLLRKGML